MADSEGFEPSRRFPAYTLSRRAPSTTRPTVPGSVLIVTEPKMQGAICGAMRQGHAGAASRDVQPGYSAGFQDLDSLAASPPSGPGRSGTRRHRRPPPGASGCAGLWHHLPFLNPLAVLAPDDGMEIRFCMPDHHTLHARSALFAPPLQAGYRATGFALAPMSRYGPGTSPGCRDLSQACSSTAT